MSLDMLHAFEGEYHARFSDMQFRTECEAFSRGWVAGRDAHAAASVAEAFAATYRAHIENSAWALQAEAFQRGWQAWWRFAANEQRRLFSAGRAGVVRVRLVDTPAAAATQEHARQQALQTLTGLLRGAPARQPQPEPAP